MALDPIASKQAADAKVAADAANVKAGNADTKAGAAMNAVTNTPKVPWLGLRVVNVPAIALGGTADITLTWETPAPAADYAVATTVEGSAAILGTVSVGLKDGSRTVNGCVITVKSTAILTNGAAKINVVAGRSASQVVS